MNQQMFGEDTEHGMDINQTTLPTWLVDYIITYQVFSVFAEHTGWT
jgi:hypothetical protein